jgi:hypothetical protein
MGAIIDCLAHIAKIENLLEERHGKFGMTIKTVFEVCRSIHVYAALV